MNTHSCKKRTRIEWGIVDSSTNYHNIKVVASVDCKKPPSEHPDIDVMYMTRENFEAFKRSCPERLMKFKNAINQRELDRKVLYRFIMLNIRPNKTVLDKQKIQAIREHFIAKDREAQERLDFKADIFFKRMKETAKKLMKAGMFEEKKSLEFQGLTLSEVCVK